MIQLLVGRQFAQELPKSTKEGKFITSIINPGLVKTQITRHASRLFMLYVKTLQATISRTPEVGGSMLVLASEGDESMHGQYLCDGKIAQWVPLHLVMNSDTFADFSRPSEWVISDESKPVQEQLWRELTAKLEAIHPGIMGNL